MQQKPEPTGKVQGCLSLWVGEKRAPGLFLTLLMHQVVFKLGELVILQLQRISPSRYDPVLVAS